MMSKASILAGLLLVLPGLAFAGPAPSGPRDLDTLRREIEDSLQREDQPGLPDRSDAAPSVPSGLTGPASNRPAALSDRDRTKPGGYDAVVAVPAGYTGPTAKIAVGTMAQAIVDMGGNSDYPGPWRAKLLQPLTTIDGSTVIAPAGSTVVGLSERAGGPNEPINNRMIFTPLMIVLPNADTIPLVGQYQLDGSGVAGIRGRADYHLDIQAAAIGGASIADALPSVIAQALGVDSASRIRDTTIQSLSDNGRAILERYTQLVPTVEVQPGAPVSIFFLRETIAPAWRSAERYQFERPRR